MLLGALLCILGVCLGASVKAGLLMWGLVAVACMAVLLLS